MGLCLAACKPDIQRATGAVGAGVGYGTSGATGGAAGAGGSGGAGGAGACTTDADCAMGAEWCQGGTCVACDNSGPTCNTVCPPGWTLYQRNGCQPCDCAPPNECILHSDCGAGTVQCYAGRHCWDWCPPEDPSCCFGNVCGVAGCGPNAAGCFVTGCPLGQECIEAECTSLFCDCDGSMWSCGGDCLGGVCM